MILEEFRDNFNAKRLISTLHYNIELQNELILKTSYLINNPSLSERMYCWYYNIGKLLTCKHCSKPLKFHKFTYGYFPTCGSKECRSISVIIGNKQNHNHTESILKMKNTYAKNHNGIMHNMQDPEFVKKFMENKQHNTVKKYLAKYGYSIISANNGIYDIQCNKCGAIFRNINGQLIHYNLYRNKLFCENCYDKKSYTVRSKFEESVYKYVLTLILNEDIITNRKVGKKFYIYDIVLHNKKLVIECNGIYYHSTACLPDTEYHYKKMVNANEAGYDVIQIWQDDWYNNTDDIKNKLLLYITPINVFINDCNIENNKIYYGNLCILEICKNDNVILLNYLSNYVISDIYEYIKNTYSSYYIEHNLDFPLLSFEKLLQIKQCNSNVYYLYNKRKNVEYKENTPLIYTTGTILLMV